MTDQNNDFQKTLVDALLSERRNDRHWRIIKTFIWLAIFIAILLSFYVPKHEHSNHFDGKPYVSLVRLNGVIMPGSSFSARDVLPLLARAFKDKNSKGVVLLINSPGGSPVQASIIHDDILYLKAKYHKKVLVLGEDTLASGAYLVATAADSIYVNQDTLTGSIGVIMSGFGFDDAIQKLGISRRVFTAGDNKDRLDPFMPLNDADKAKVAVVLNAVHQDFIADVTTSRQGKLHGDPAELFSGDFWTGSQAQALGLVDGTGNLWTLLRTQFGVTHYRDYSRRPTFFEALFKGAETKLGFSLENNVSPLKEEL